MAKVKEVTVRFRSVVRDFDGEDVPAIEGVVKIGKSTRKFGFVVTDIKEIFPLMRKVLIKLAE